MGTIKQFLITTFITTAALFAQPNDINTSSKKELATKTLNSEFKTKFRLKNSVLLRNISNNKLLRRVYRNSHYNLLWLNQDLSSKQTFNIKKTQLFKHIKNDPTLEHQGKIYTTYQQLNNPIDTNLSKTELFKVELKLTSLYYEYLQHSLYGGIQWKNFSRKLSSLKRYRINASWIRNKAPYNINKLLLGDNIDETMKKITPSRFGYKKLLTALEKLKEIQTDGGWEKLPKFKRLQIGSQDTLVIALRDRLKASNDYRMCKETNTTIQTKEINSSLENNETVQIDPETIFDACLDEGVKRFQKRHGLVVDGIVGGGTQKALNLSVESKIEKILLNIDRIKWLPRKDDKRYIVVNIPEFMLHYIENNQTKKELAVIVGDTKHPTPIFSEKISYIVLNPYWKVPEGIVKREIVPKMVKNPNYLRRQGLQAHVNWSENSPIVNTSHLFWEDYLEGGQTFPYRLMQPPGPRNALGKIKFKFPNRFAVYLHDTPTRYLFKKTKRAFSHGCVRLSNPVELLETIASFNKHINLDKAKKTLKGKRKTQLDVKTKLPIYLVYLTVGLNKNDEIEFRNDIYRYDKFQKRIAR